ncbi:MAG: zinc ribbon domain-containing protein [Oscillospiraceae bacterium]|nr:zinc ribbon domain-containing protein [Oscillospiraceae bacterium]
MEFSSISEKAAYLLGLIKGKNVDDEITVMAAELLHDIARTVDDMGRDIDDLADQVDDLDQELSFLADDYDEDDEDEDDDEDVYSMACPNCGEQIEFEESVLEDGVLTCPACGTPIEVGLADDDMED